jgi:hypothetical protein
MMPTRQTYCTEAVEGYLKSDVPLVGWNENAGYYFAPYADDPGIYYFVPKISAFFGLPVESAVNVFFTALLLFGLLVCTVSIYFLWKKPLPRLYAFLGVSFLFLRGYHHGDIYSAFFPAHSLFLLFLLLINKNLSATIYRVSFFLLGLFTVFFNSIRAHSMTGALIAILLYFFLSRKFAIKQTIICLLFFLAGFFGLSSGKQLIYIRAMSFISQQGDGKTDFNIRRPFWHSVYIGMGFVGSEEIPSYLDCHAISAVEKRSPGTVYCSIEYEKTLRQLFFSFIKKNFSSFLMNVFAKFGVIFCLFVILANFGFFISFIYHRDYRFEFSFWLAVIFNSLFGFLVVPYPRYLQGMLCLAVFYNIIHTNRLLERSSFTEFLSDLKYFFGDKSSKKLFLF